MRSLKKWILLSLFAATAFVLQIALASFPNIELVTLWFLIIAQFVSWKESLIIVFIFSVLEALVWGFGDWVVAYLWVWTLWMILVQVAKPLFKQSEYRWAFLGSLFGFLFGLLFSLQHALLYGVNMGLIYWMRGILFDITHAASNFIIIMLLYKPLYKVIQRLLEKWSINHEYHN